VLLIRLYRLSSSIVAPALLILTDVPMEPESPFDPEALDELTKDLNQLKVELLLDSGGSQHLDEIEQVLIDSIDNVLEEVDEYKQIEKITQDKDKLRRKQVKIEALVLFVNEALDFSESGQEEITFKNEEHPEN
jgi:hypothetical protein